jgi:Tol biopolymer transport system component
MAMTENPVPHMPEPLQSWKLAFVRNNNIYVGNADGTNQKLIIESGRNPSWSPDKSQIAFVRQNNIWVAMADGSNQRAVTSQWKGQDPKHDSLVSDIRISWHPKNGSITFSHPEVFKIERAADGTAGIVPTRNAAKDEIIGSSIFDIPKEGSEPFQAIVRCDLFGRGTSFSFADQAHPAWSPSGRKLAFTRHGDLWIAEVKAESEGEPPIGWEAKRVAAVALYAEASYRASSANRGATGLSWHPEERLLAFEYARLGGSGFNEIHLLDTATGRDSLLVEDAMGPQFSPDGKYILYWSYAEEQCGKGICICTVSADGKEKHKIISDGKDPVW